MDQYLYVSRQWSAESWENEAREEGEEEKRTVKSTSMDDPLAGKIMHNTVEQFSATN